MNALDLDNFAIEPRPLPLPDPIIEGGTPEEKLILTQTHQASFTYLWGCLHAAYAVFIGDQRASDEFIRWFGETNRDEKTTILGHYFETYIYMHNTPITYYLDQHSQHPPGTPGKIPEKTENSIVIYPDFYQLPFSGITSQIGALIYLQLQLATTIMTRINGIEDCLELAQNSPMTAVSNAASYQYFAESTLPMNFGIDSIATFGVEPRTHATLGNMYIVCEYNPRTQTFLVLPEYPSYLTDGYWNALPPEFENGFDSMSALQDGRLRVTKGAEFIDYIGGNQPTIPQPLTDGFSQLREEFANGLDAMAYFPSETWCYITRGPLMSVYDGLGELLITETEISYEWGALPDAFKLGLNAMDGFDHEPFMVIRNGRYVISEELLIFERAPQGFLFEIIQLPEQPIVIT